VRLLLDTRVVLWSLDDSPELRPDAREAITDSRNDVLVSAVSAWEVATKIKDGRLRARDDLEDAIQSQRFAPLAITVAHGARAGALPPHHRDTFDRMLVAQAQLEGLTLVTRDRRLAQYEVPILPA
jgi:PIN domain nuclease of toxin-antitoxin system